MIARLSLHYSQLRKSKRYITKLPYYSPTVSGEEPIFGMLILRTAECRDDSRSCGLPRRGEAGDDPDDDATTIPWTANGNVGSKAIVTPSAATDIPVDDRSRTLPATPKNPPKAAQRCRLSATTMRKTRAGRRPSVCSTACSLIRSCTDITVVVATSESTRPDAGVAEPVDESDQLGQVGQCVGLEHAFGSRRRCDGTGVECCVDLIGHRRRRRRDRSRWTSSCVTVPTSLAPRARCRKSRCV